MDGKPEAEPDAVEFPEWELLHDSNSNSNSNEEPVDFVGIDSDAAALIRHDYFSLHPNVSVSVSNSNSSSGSSTDPAEVDRNFDDSYVANQLFPGGEMYVIKESPPSNLQIWNDSDSDGDAKTMAVAETTSGELLDGDGDGDGGFNSKEEEEEEKEKEEEQEEERRMVWWKVPFEVFKYWVVRVSPVPVWSLSVAAAAAFVGLVILGRRLYKMKRKTQSLKLNIALDDKKVSQLMGRVARLNEAFSVVRRVPTVRPSLPASSVILRPVMSMR